MKEIDKIKEELEQFLDNEYQNILTELTFGGKANIEFLKRDVWQFIETKLKEKDKRVEEIIEDSFEAGKMAMHRWKESKFKDSMFFTEPLELLKQQYLTPKKGEENEIYRI